MKDEIIRMAREAGWGNLVSMPHIEALKRFATLRDEAMKKRCAEVCKQQDKSEYPRTVSDEWFSAATAVCAAAIMALDTESTNLCQNSTKLVEKRGRAGSFSE